MSLTVPVLADLTIWSSLNFQKHGSYTSRTYHLSKCFKYTSTADLSLSPSLSGSSRIFVTGLKGVSEPNVGLFEFLHMCIRMKI